MKKRVTKLLSVLLALVCMFSLVACGGGSGEDVSGSYSLQTLEMQGMSMDMEAIKKTMEDAGQDASSINISIDLEAGGSFKLNMDDFDQSMSMNGTWKSTSGGVELTVDGETLSATLADGVLTLEEEGVKMTFKK